MGLIQDLQAVARLQREPVTVSAVTHTLTENEIATGTIRCTYASGTQTVNIPDAKGPPFFIVAAGGQTVTIDGLYGTFTTDLTTKLSALCHYVDGLGWFCMSSVASAT